MRNKIIVTIVIGLAVAGLIALAWWWFFSRPNPTPAQTGTFGSAQNASTTPTTTNPQTNISTPVGISTQPAKSTLPSGAYQIKSLNGQNVGTYQFGLAETTPGAGGDTYAITSTDGAGALGPGTYTITVDGVTSDYAIGALAPGSYSFTIDGVTSSYAAGAGNNTIFTVNPIDLSTNATTTDTGIVDLGSTNTPGVDFLNNPGDGGSITSNAGTVFNPTATNQIINPTASGGVLPNIGGIDGSGSNNGLGIGTALVGAAVAGGLSCGAAQLFDISSTALGVKAGAATPAGVVAAATTPVVTPLVPVTVQTIDFGNYVAQGAAASALGGILGGLKGGQLSDFSTNTFFSCLARTVAKIAIQQITSSVVNWINSRFDGSPSFVTSPEQFFTNVADNAAGQFIRGSALSFLCSPFQLQIKLAIAQSYANRNAQSCTLTNVVRNINGFMNGSFSNGGWAGLISFTTMPTNNPYGAFAAASIGINSATNGAVASRLREQSLGSGFLDFKKKQNCTVSINPATAPVSTASQSVTLRQASGPVAPNQQGVALGETVYEVCDLVSTTPGSVISASLNKTLGGSLDSLNLAKSFDEIISALITQLMTRTLKGGLSNLSGPNGYESNFYTPDQLAAQTAAQSLVIQLQGDNQIAQSYGGVQQGSISDIQNAQNQLNDLSNCLSGAAAASSTSSVGVASATNATVASTTITQLEAKVSGLNNEITRSNNAITLLVQFQSAALSAGSQLDISNVATDYANARAQGQLITAGDLTNAQQNRTTLQSQLAALNEQTSTNLAQCNAGL